MLRGLAPCCRNIVRLDRKRGSLGARLGLPLNETPARDGETAEALADPVDRAIQSAVSRGLLDREQIELSGRCELCYADTEQADRGPGLRPQPRVEQLGGDRRDHARLLRRRLDMLLAGVGGEVPATDLDGHATRGKLPATQAPCRPVRETRELRVQLTAIRNVIVEGFFR